MAQSAVQIVFVFLFASEFFWVQGSSVNPNDVVFRVYTKNQTTTFNTTKLATDEIKSVNITQSIIFIIHGWQASTSSAWIQTMTKLLIKKQPCNVITVDWSAYSSSKNYPATTTLVKPVGNLVGDFIVNITTNNSRSLEKVHIIGHSLGAHIAGYAGQRVFAKIKKKLARITGLDAAGPLFCFKPKNERLSKGDAHRVNAIHTNGGVFGYLRSYGTSDYFPNGGGPLQPGCTTNACSHSRSHDLYVESIVSDKFIAVQCSSYQSYLAGSCDSNNKTIMGDEEPSTASGNYYLTTNRSPPYAKGDYFPQSQTATTQ